MQIICTVIAYAVNDCETDMSNSIEPGIDIDFFRGIGIGIDIDFRHF